MLMAALGILLLLNQDEQEKFLNTKLLIYVCEGTEKEIKDWFRTINILGIPLNAQETLNAVYSGLSSQSQGGVFTTQTIPTSTSGVVLFLVQQSVRIFCIQLLNG